MGDYLVKCDTLSDANNRRRSQFFRDIYKHLYNQYRHLLSNSRLTGIRKRLYIIDSTTITLFSTMLKGADRNPKHGRKKGGVKAHCVIRYDEWAPLFVDFTSAATHDIRTLKGGASVGGLLCRFGIVMASSKGERLHLENVASEVYNQWAKRLLFCLLFRAHFEACLKRVLKKTLA